MGNVFRAFKASRKVQQGQQEWYGWHFYELKTKEKDMPYVFRD